MRPAALPRAPADHHYLLGELMLDLDPPVGAAPRRVGTSGQLRHDPFKPQLPAGGDRFLKGGIQRWWHLDVTIRWAVDCLFEYFPALRVVKLEQ